MKNRELLIITGITGFIGSHILSKLQAFEKGYEIVGFSSNKIYRIINTELHEISGLSLINLIKKTKRASLIHLATFYSLKEKHKEEIIKANEQFGYDLFDSYGIKEFNKIIYTNSIFTFSNDEKIKKSTYVKTKKNFSGFLKEYSDENSSSFTEIFLGNTIGKNDSRPKLIPKIISSLKNNEVSPISNPEQYINLVPVTVVADMVLGEVLKESNKYSIISKFDYKISSIYEFCKNEVNQHKGEDIVKQITKEKELLPANIRASEININLEKELRLLIS